MIDKGRAKFVAWKFIKPEQRVRGEANHSKLKEDDVRRLRQMYADGKGSYVVLGKLFGLGHSTVENIVKRRKWAHVR
jgi:hypothetical protein